MLEVTPPVPDICGPAGVEEAAGGSGGVGVGVGVGCGWLWVGEGRRR